MEKEELIAYDNVSIAEQDEKGKLTAATKKGRKEGAENKEIEAVLGFYRNGVSVEIIAKSLNLTAEKVEQVIENQSDK
jgi:predicted transposase YdaD